MLGITKDHVIGFLTGFGFSVVGFYLYKKNQAQVEEFLRSQGIEIPGSQGAATSKLSLEELVREKEHLEDLIAEKELMGKADVPMNEKTKTSKTAT